MNPVDLSLLPDSTGLPVLVDRYGHGDCADLAAYLSEIYGLTPIWVVAMTTGMPVHVFVQVGTRALDAYGISDLATVLGRYGLMIEQNLGELATFELQERSEFLRRYRCDEDAFEDADAAFKAMLAHLDITHNELVRDGQRQMARVHVAPYRFMTA